MEHFINEIITFLSPLGIIAFFIFTAVKTMKKKDLQPTCTEEQTFQSDTDVVYHETSDTFQDIHQPAPVFHEPCVDKIPFKTSPDRLETEEEEGAKSDFDLRKAVISSEILRRPEF